MMIIHCRKIFCRFPFSSLTLLVGRQEWHLACKNWMLVFWWWQFGWCFARLMAPVVTHLNYPASLKSRMETFWYWLTQVHLENGRKNGETKFLSYATQRVLSGNLEC